MDRDLYWIPTVELSQAEERIAKRAAKKRKLFVFLRTHRHEIFDQDFQDELIDMYRTTGAGKPPHPPAMLAMATLLQKYAGVADNEAVELTVDSKRWQMVLGCLGREDPLFAQSVLYDFRMRLMATGMDKRLLAYTADFARRQGGFPPKALRLALDSAPLRGAGRVEDTINLLAHAARKVVACVAELANQTAAEVIDRMGLTLFDAPSIKAALDIDWSDHDERHNALQRLISELEALEDWLHEHMEHEVERLPLKDALQLLHDLMDQDLEPDPSGGIRIREGVAKDRRISIRDGTMRHGRKSKSRTIEGFKRHISRDLDAHVICSACVRPANESDAQAAEQLIGQALNGDQELASLHIDCGYLHAPSIAELDEQGVSILCRARRAAQSNYFAKEAFEINLEAGHVRCPAGQQVAIDTTRRYVEFCAQTCKVCPLRDRCTSRKQGGRTVTIHPQEALHQSLRAAQKTPEGRQRLRERVDVEHALAHTTRRQGARARYLGTLKNSFDLRIVCAVQNLERAHALAQAA